MNDEYDKYINNINIFLLKTLIYIHYKIYFKYKIF